MNRERIHHLGIVVFRIGLNPVETFDLPSLTSGCKNRFVRDTVPLYADDMISKGYNKIVHPNRAIIDPSVSAP